MNCIEINGLGAAYQINMKKVLSGDSTVNRVEANRAYTNASDFGSCLKDGRQVSTAQSFRWMDRYLLNLVGIKENDTVTLRGVLNEYESWHSLGNVPFRPNTDMRMMEKQAELIAAGTGLILKDYIDLTTRIKHYSLRIPFDVQSSCITVEVDEQEGCYIIIIQELEFKKQCNEVIRRFLNWWDVNIWQQQISPEFLFLKRFCDLKSDRQKTKEQKQSVEAAELQKKENMADWEERTLAYVKEVDWDTVDISLEFAMVDPLGAAVGLRLENLSENELSREGILLPKKLHFAELDQSIAIEKQLDYLPEEFKTRVICAMVKHLNEVYKAKQPDFYEYKKWHMICERKDFSMKFSKKFTYYSDDELGIVKKSGVSFAEWRRMTEPGSYEELFEG